MKRLRKMRCWETNEILEQSLQLHQFMSDVVKRQTTLFVKDAMTHLIRVTNHKFPPDGS